MSAAHVARPGIDGPLVQTVHAYNSLVENQSLLTPAELRLGMCIVRRGGHREGVTVSDHVWRNWTGLDPRSKELAAKGLQKKCFHVQGRGDKARFSFARPEWNDFVRQASRDHKPRTEGRRVDPRPGQKLHQDCRERGCAMLMAENPPGALSLVSPASNAKPVSQDLPEREAGAIAGLDGKPSGSEQRAGCQAPRQTSINSPAPAGRDTPVSSIPSTLNAKPVSQGDYNPPPAETEWVKTLLALRSAFPLVGLPFLARLLAVVQALFSNLTDHELAVSIRRAWDAYSKSQKSAGLFLQTVPQALYAARRQAGATAQHRKIPDGLRLALEWRLERERAAGQDTALTEKLLAWRPSDTDPIDRRAYDRLAAMAPHEIEDALGLPDLNAETGIC